MSNFSSYADAFEFAARYISEVNEAQKKQDPRYDVFKSIETYIGERLSPIERLCLIEPLREALGDTCPWNIAHILWHLKHDKPNDAVVH